MVSTQYLINEQMQDAGMSPNDVSWGGLEAY